MPQLKNTQAFDGGWMDIIGDGVLTQNVFNCIYALYGGSGRFEPYVQPALAVAAHFRFENLVPKTCAWLSTRQKKLQDTNNKHHVH